MCIRDRSGIGDLAHNHAGMSLFVCGLVLIVIGTGHFKPNVSVMVGKLYGPDDPRRDGAFTIFYMGINVGAFICAFVCGTLGEKVGWHLSLIHISEPTRLLSISYAVF